MTWFTDHTTSHRANAAFTLIELAIVLVIIGLIISGLLFGGEMIKSAQIRSVSTQISKFTAATATFRIKYDGLPGDIRDARAVNFGFVTRSGAIGHGDGNSIVESCVAGGRDLGCETALFWQDLSDASLIPAEITGATDNYIDGTAVGFTLSNHLPKSNLRNGVYYHVYAINSRNTYYIGGISAIDASGVPTLANSLTPREAEDIDRKLDNGIPNTGSVRAVSDLTTTDTGGAGISGDCVVNTTTPFSYNIGSNFLDEVNCRITLSNAI